jgi:hypothetical protein
MRCTPPYFCNQLVRHDTVGMRPVVAADSASATASRPRRVLAGIGIGALTGAIVGAVFPASCSGQSDIPCSYGRADTVEALALIGALVGGIVGALLPVH